MKRIYSFLLFLFSFSLLQAQTIPQKQVTGLPDSLAALRASIGSGGSGGSSITAYNTAFVDTLGSDATGLINRADKPFKTINAALDAGASLSQLRIRLGLGSYAAPTAAKLRSNLWIEGAGRPQPNWTVTQSSYTAVTYSAPTALSGGTILKGGINFFGLSHVKVKNLGIDVGSDYVTAGGTEMNALGFSNATNDEAANTPSPAYTLLQGIEVDNVTLLCKSTTSPYHGLVMENCVDARVNGVLIVNGVHGMALKVTGGYFTNITTHNNELSGFIIKANNYSLASKIQINGFSINNASTNGIHIQNKSAQKLRDIKISNGFITGSPTGVTTTDNLGNGFTGVTLSNVVVRGATTSFATSSNYTLVSCWSDDVPLTNTAHTGVFTEVHNSTFTATDNTPIASYTPETGSVWTQQGSGQWQVISGKAQTTATATDAGLLTNGAANVRVTAVASLSSGSGALQMATRYGSGKGIIMHISSNQYQLYQNTAGSWALIGSISGGAVDTNDHTWVLTVSGPLLTLSKDGVQAFTGSVSTSIGETGVGLIQSGGATAAGYLKVNSAKIEALQ